MITNKYDTHWFLKPHQHGTVLIIKYFSASLACLIFLDIHNLCLLLTSLLVDITCRSFLSKPMTVKSFFLSVFIVDNRNIKYS